MLSAGCVRLLHEVAQVHVPFASGTKRQGKNLSMSRGSVQLGLGAFYSINDFMQKALPPDFSNSEVSTMTGSSPSFCNVSPRLLVRWEVM